MASLAELTDNPFVQNTIDSVALRDATDLPKTRIIVRPQNTPDNEPVKQDDSKLQNIIDKLFGLNGQERYQLWPEFTNRAFGNDLEIYKDGERPANGLIDLAQQAHLLPSDKYNVFKDLSTFVKDPVTGIANDIRSVRRLAKGFADSIVSGVTAPHDAIEGKIPTYQIDENGNVRPSDEIIHRAMDVAGLAGSGGLAGAGSEAGVALGSAPFLRPALKYGEKLYKGKPGQQHMDVIPADLYPTFQKQAMSGEDISNFNFGFLNHKGQFLSREDALKYAIDNGLVDPHSAQYGALTSTLMSDTAKPGTAINALTNSQPKFDFSIGTNSGSKSVKIGPTEITYGVNPKNNDVELSLIRTDKNKRNKGSARNAIEQFLNEADNNGKRVLLNADPMDKSTNKNKLVDFYKSLGFVRNKGSNKDFSTRAEYIRDPILKSDTSKPGAALAAVANTNKPFYSAVENAIAAAKQPKADAQQWLSFLKNQPGVKQEELAHLGLDKLQGSITKDDLLKAVQEGQPQIKEVIKKDITDDDIIDKAFEHVKKNHPDVNRSTPQFENLVQNKYEELKKITSPTKYQGYQLPGGENYREMLLTLPNELKGEKAAQFDKHISEGRGDLAARLTKELPDDYKSSHWDEPNVLAHIRMNDRTIDGKKTLHLEEIQSDWHQAGRKQGYQQKEINPDEITLKKVQSTVPEGHDPSNYPGYWESFDKNGNLISRHRGNSTEAEAKAEAIKSAELNNKVLIPDAPFKKTWDELALKKAITEAVKNGYDQISWTPGEAQAARYDLSRQVDAIKAIKNSDGTYTISTKRPGRHGDDFTNLSGGALPENKLADFVGKELAEKIIKDANEGSKVWGVKNKASGNWSQRFATKEEANKYQLSLPESVRNKTEVLEMVPKTSKEYSGLDLKIGGQGMKAFYDKMLVDKMNALTKKYGGKVEQKDLASGKRKTLDEISNDLGFGGWHSNLTETQKSKIMSVFDEQKPQREGKTKVHVLKITPELREQVLKKGLPLFSAGVPIFTPVPHNPFKDNYPLPNDKNTIRPEDVQSYRTYGDNNGKTQEKL